MKEGWEYKSLGDVCDILDSRRKPITKNKRESGTIPYYGATGILDYVKDYIFDEKLVLLGEDGAKWGAGENSAYIVEGKTWVNNHAHALRPKRELLIDELLVYYLNFANLQPFITGVTVPKLNQEKMRSIEIPVPSLPEQQSIVDYLDSAFAKIDAMKANAEKALNEAKALFQASLKEMLEPKEGWEEKTLGEMSEIQSGFAFKSTQFQKRGEFQVIRMGNVRPGVIRYNESPVFIDSVDKNTIEKALLKVGDMIITQTGSRNKRDYGFTVLIDKEKLLLNQRIARIRVINTITNKYLLYYSWTDYFRDQYFANEGGTVGQGNVGIDAIRYAVISYPPISEQQSIVETLDSLKSKVDRLQENYNKISQECDALKQAILRQVFE